MFDQNDQNQQTQGAAVTPVVDPGTTPSPAADPTLPAPDLSAPQVPSAPLPEPAAPAADTAMNFSTPSLPDADIAVPAGPAAAEPIISDTPPSVTPTPAPAISNDLLSIKQGALQDLTPLLDHLDQSPEEKFRTTMMMIQASDDQSLVQTAYDAAKSITDEKVRAQALLDVVNEINYFTQQAKPAVA